MQGALAGLRIVDLTQMLAGPFCTMLLADLGADVLKVEQLEGDPVRSEGPRAPGDTLGAFGGFFQSVNRNKRSLALDLKSEDGRAVLRRLVRQADVLVENFRLGVPERLGITYESLREENPRLVYACIRGFGDPRTGASPYADWPAFDIVAQAMGGLMSTTGPGPGQPVKIGPGVGDIVPGMYAALGILAAVRHADRTGEGQFLDVAMYDAILALCERIVYRYSYIGEVAEPYGNTHPFLCPFDVFPARDGAVAIAAPFDHLWQALAEAIGRPDMAADERFRGAGRRKHCAEVRAAITAWTSVRTKVEIAAALGGRVPFGPVNTVADIMADPHTAVRQMIATVEQPGRAQPVQIAASPIHMTATPPAVERRAPLLGEHTDAALASAGYTPDEVAALRARGVVR
jgi:crotonobetainyl-CoA:carnitine CoA-transferase CaiB-like acyl-CoA transferase